VGISVQLRLLLGFRSIYRLVVRDQVDDQKVKGMVSMESICLEYDICVKYAF
jgi:hypothetical protein